MQSGELLGNGPAVAVVIDPLAVEPQLGTSWTGSLAAVFVKGAVGKFVGIAGCGYLWVPVERRQRRERTIEAIIAAAGTCGAAVVDELPVGVGAGIGEGDELVAVAEDIFDVLLVSGVFDRLKSLGAVYARLGEVGEGRVRIGQGDIITELTQVVEGEGGTVGGVARHEAEVVAEMVGDSLGGVVDRPGVVVARPVGGGDVEMSLGGIVGENDVDQKTVAAEELGCGVEGTVDCLFGGGGEAAEVLGGGPPVGWEVRVGGQVYADGEHGEVLLGAGLETPCLMGGLAGEPAGAVCFHRGDAAVVGGSGAVEVAGGASLIFRTRGRVPRRCRASDVGRAVGWPR